MLDRYQQLLKDRYVGRRKGAAAVLADQWGEHILTSTADLLQEAEKPIKDT
ncbi:hypothetical protein [Rhizobium tubonense]|uniref:hypothetical protein n=1 Tax=Rhizobium tubonense TaxID=484088 RepID=UPI0012B6A7B0|nr:hypothetical protein [Rhizobium tubonense]